MRLTHHRRLLCMAHHVLAPCLSNQARRNAGWNLVEKWKPSSSVAIEKCWTEGPSFLFADVVFSVGIASAWIQEVLVGWAHTTMASLLTSLAGFRYWLNNEINEWQMADTKYMFTRRFSCSARSLAVWRCWFFSFRTTLPRLSNELSTPCTSSSSVNGGNFIRLSALNQFLRC